MIRGFEDWLGQYGDAWMNGDPEAALRLFAEGAAYFETPFDPPMVGHDAIRRYWTEGARDAQRNVRFEATPIAHDGTTGFAFWRATFDRVPSGTRVELEGVMSVKLDSELRCTVFREWWHRRETCCKFTAPVMAGVTSLRAFAKEDPNRSTTMRPDPKAVAKLGQDYTAAWNSKSPEAVACYFAADGEIVINRGEPWTGRARVAEMAAGFFADVPDMSLTCDEIRVAGSHAVYVWTFTGHDAKTGNPLNVRGWEEWDLDDDLKIRASRGWYDAEAYAAQVAGG